MLIGEMSVASRPAKLEVLFEQLKGEWHELFPVTSFCDKNPEVEDWDG